MPKYENAVYDGKNVALVYYTNRQHMSKMRNTLSATPEHHFITKAGSISLCWVPEKYVDKFLAYVEGCCGNPPRPNVYLLATPLQVKRWTENNAHATLD
jgi:hypothetical protein